MTRAEALADLRRAFAAAGLDDAARDARLLVLAALGAAPTDLVLRPDEPVTKAEAATLRAFARRRLAGEPVARILGEWEFWGMPFTLSPETLVPRPETETVVETALRQMPAAASPRVLDLGTGTGCLLVALLHERPRALGLGVDRSPAALATAKANARRNGVAPRASFAASDWASAVRGPFDLVVSNPPYIATGTIAALDVEVRAHDPVAALDGGFDGLDAYRVILGDARRLLAAGGTLVVEIGFDQEDAVRGLAAPANLEIRAVSHDLSGHARCLAFVPA